MAWHAGCLFNVLTYLCPLFRESATSTVIGWPSSPALCGGDSVVRPSWPLLLSSFTKHPHRAPTPLFTHATLFVLLGHLPAQSVKLAKGYASTEYFVPRP